MQMTWLKDDAFHLNCIQSVEEPDEFRDGQPSSEREGENEDKPEGTHALQASDIPTRGHEARIKT